MVIRLEGLKLLEEILIIEKKILELEKMIDDCKLEIDLEEILKIAFHS